MAVTACANSPSVATPADTPAASGRNEATTPAATVVAAKTRPGRSMPPERRLPSRPASAWSVSVWWTAGPASQGTAASGASALMAVIAMTTTYPVFWASQTPDGRATIAGTHATTPARPIPSPRRSAGTDAATRAPRTTVARPNPMPRAMLTAMIVAMLCGSSSAGAGPPSSSAPAANTAR